MVVQRIQKLNGVAPARSDPPRLVLSVPAMARKMARKMLMIGGFQIVYTSGSVECETYLHITTNDNDKTRVQRDAVLHIARDTRTACGCLGIAS